MLPPGAQVGEERACGSPTTAKSYSALPHPQFSLLLTQVALGHREVGSAGLTKEMGHSIKR